MSSNRPPLPPAGISRWLWYGRLLVTGGIPVAWALVTLMLGVGIAAAVVWIANASAWWIATGGLAAIALVALIGGYRAWSAENIRATSAAAEVVRAPREETALDLVDNLAIDLRAYRESLPAEGTFVAVDRLPLWTASLRHIEIECKLKLGRSGWRFEEEVIWSEEGLTDRPDEPTHMDRLEILYAYLERRLARIAHYRALVPLDRETYVQVRLDQFLESNRRIQAEGLRVPADATASGGEEVQRLLSQTTWWMERLRPFIQTHLGHRADEIELANPVWYTLTQPEALTFLRAREQELRTVRRGL